LNSTWLDRCNQQAKQARRVRADHANIDVFDDRAQKREKRLPDLIRKNVRVQQQAVGRGDRVAKLEIWQFTIVRGYLGQSARGIQ